MWTEALLTPDPDHGVFVPKWLGPSDEAWLAALLEVRAAFAGRPRSEFDERMRDPLPVDTTAARRAAALRVVEQLASPPPKPPASPREVREALFGAAATDAQPRSTLVTGVAARFGLSAEQVDALLFTDLASARPLAPLPADASPALLARRTNLEMAKGFLASATTVHVEARGNVRALLRYAKTRGLIAVVPTGGFRDDSAEMDLSGPFLLFRHTALYARALAGLVPVLAACDAFELRARLELPHRVCVVQLASGDPVFEPARDSVTAARAPSRLRRELAASAWEVDPDPPPVDANGVLLFPDFALVDRAGGRRVPVEIAGFWTPDTVRARLLRMRQAGLDHAILCIDDERNCSEDEPPASPNLVRFRKRLDGATLLAAVAPVRHGVPTK